MRASGINPSPSPAKTRIVSLCDRQPRANHSEMLARADNALINLSESFVDEAQCQMMLLEEAMDGAQAAAAIDDTDTRDNRFIDAYGAAHEIRGQAGSFNYDLLTIVCGSLCDLIELHQRDGERLDLLAPMQLHVSMAREVLNRNLMGDGGPFGTALSRQVTNLNRLLQSGIQPTN